MVEPQVFPGLSLRRLGRVTLAREDSTRALGAVLATSLGSHGFVGLVGDLGAGKTTLVQGFMEALRRQDDVSSPTYALMNRYEGAPLVHHVDLYRLASAEDLESIGYWDHLEEGGIFCVEWLDRIWEAWPGAGLILHWVETHPVRIVDIYADSSTMEQVMPLLLDFLEG